jgi:hypothetical protein
MAEKVVDPEHQTGREYRAAYLMNRWKYSLLTASKPKRSGQFPHGHVQCASGNFWFWIYAVPMYAACPTSASTCRSPLMLLWSASWCSPSVHQTWCQTARCKNIWQVHVKAGVLTVVNYRCIHEIITH